MPGRPVAQAEVGVGNLNVCRQLGLSPWMPRFDARWTVSVQGWHTAVCTAIAPKRYATNRSIEREMSKVMLNMDRGVSSATQVDNFQLIGDNSSV
jgi:hypothetical protein